MVVLGTAQSTYISRLFRSYFITRIMKESVLQKGKSKAISPSTISKSKSEVADGEAHQ